MWRPTKNSTLANNNPSIYVHLTKKWLAFYEARFLRASYMLATMLEPVAFNHINIRLKTIRGAKTQFQASPTLCVCYTSSLSPLCDNLLLCSLSMVHLVCMQTTNFQPKLKTSLKVGWLMEDLTLFENLGNTIKDSQLEMRGKGAKLCNGQ